MNAMSKGDLFPKIVEAYARPTRIIYGKDVDHTIEVPCSCSLLNKENLFVAKLEVYPDLLHLLNYESLGQFVSHSRNSCSLLVLFWTT